MRLLCAALMSAAGTVAAAEPAPTWSPVSSTDLHGLCESYNALAVEERRRLGPITDRPGEAFTLRLRSRLARDCALATRTALWRVGAPELQAAALIYTRALIDARATLTDLARPGAPAPHRVAVSHVLTTAGLREAAAFWHALVEALGTPRMPPPPDPQTVRRRVELR